MICYQPAANFVERGGSSLSPDVLAVAAMEFGAGAFLWGCWLSQCCYYGYSACLL